MRFSTLTMASSLHRDGCPCGTARTRVHVQEEVEGNSPVHAITEWRQGEQADERGLPKTTIAGCLKC